MTPRIPKVFKAVIVEHLYIFIMLAPLLSALLVRLEQNPFLDSVKMALAYACHRFVFLIENIVDNWQVNNRHKLAMHQLNYGQRFTYFALYLNDIN